MNGKILIAGGGHGGLAAAYHLAKNGADVTVLEANSRFNMGWNQPDSVNLNCFAMVPDISLRNILTNIVVHSLILYKNSFDMSISKA